MKLREISRKAQIWHKRHWSPWTWLISITLRYLQSLPGWAAQLHAVVHTIHHQGRVVHPKAHVRNQLETWSGADVVGCCLMLFVLGNYSFKFQFTSSNFRKPRNGQITLRFPCSHFQSPPVASRTLCLVVIDSSTLASHQAIHNIPCFLFTNLATCQPINSSTEKKMPTPQKR